MKTITIQFRLKILLAQIQTASISISNYLIYQMCICFPKQQNTFCYFFSQLSRLALGNKLFGNIQKRGQLLAMKILQCFDNEATAIFHNATIYTMDEENPIAEALAIKGNKILKVGRKQDVFKLQGSETKIIDVQKKVILPGFIDPHIHMCFSMIDHWLDLGPFANHNMDQVKQKIKRALPQANPKQLLAGQLFDPTITPGEFDASINTLDSLSKDIGIFILEANGHIAHVNSAALKLAGIDKYTQDPPHGRLIRDENGQLTGQIQESAVGLFKDKFPHISQQQYKLNFRNFLTKCTSKGCTSLHDCGIGFIDPKADLSALYEIFNQGAPVRYSGFLVSTAWQTWKEFKIIPSKDDNYLRIIGMKCWADGSTQGGSAFLKENYLIQKWGRGKLNYQQEQIYKVIKRSHDEGWQVGVHTNGDAAIQIVLDTFQKVQNANPKPELRHRIQHSTICDIESLYRMKMLRISPSFLIGHIYYYGQVFQQILGEQRANKTDPLRSAFGFCLKPTIHSDYNCQPVDPLRCIYNAVTRRMKKSKKVLNQKQCVSAYEAIQAMTINAAWQCHMDDIVGSLEEGKMADFVILREDPIKINPEQLMNIKIDSTWMDGQITYKCQ